MRKKRLPITEITRRKLILAQQKRMQEGRHNFYKGHPVSDELRKKLSAIHKGSILSLETRKKMSASQLGKKRKPFSEQGRKNMSLAHIGKKQSQELIKKRLESRKGYRHSEKTRRKMSESQKGEKSYRWRGGLTEIHKIIRRSVEFKLWREAVFKRDDWTCQECKKKGGRLHPHHIKSFSQFPELRFEVNNGITLCQSCHYKTDNYGGKSIK